MFIMFLRVIRSST